MNSFSSRQQLAIALALLMLATRFHHFGSSVKPPDASLAVFFLAGYYLRGTFAFPLLLAEAGLIDFLAIAHFGVSDYCVTPAYPFLIPAYACPWVAGRWFRGKSAMELRSLLPLAGSLLLGVTASFLLSNGSFYLLSGYVSEPNWSQYSQGVAQYFPPTVAGAFLYMTFASLLHGAVHALKPSRPIDDAGRT